MQPGGPPPPQPSSLFPNTSAPNPQNSAAAASAAAVLQQGAGPSAVAANPAAAAWLASYGNPTGLGGSNADPVTPVGSPMKAASSSRLASAAVGSPSSATWFSPNRSRLQYNDRFIPSRAAAARLEFSALDRELTTDQVTKTAQEREDLNPAYSMLLRSELLGCQCPSPISPDKHTALEQLKANGSPAKKILRFKSGDPSSPLAGPPPQSPFITSPVGVDSLLGASLLSPRKPPRRIPRAPFKVLDAPALQDDFYLNLVDWSAQNVLAVGLGSCVYLWSACTSKVTKLVDLGAGDGVCSVAWSQRGTYLSVGSNSGTVQIYDVAAGKRTRTMAGHRQRVSTQAWASALLCSGSRDRAILQRDVRAPDEYVARLLGHKSEVCGLRWSPDDRQLASGGNDNALFIWQPTSTTPVQKFTDHTAAVKAIAWSPHQHGLLATGGGTQDRTIRFWNTTTGTPLNTIDTGSQVCCLAWSKNVNEIVSAHGYSQNQIVVWKYPTMTKLATLTGHSYRVLYLAVSPDGQTIVTGAGDETLRFWNVFPGPKTPGPGTEHASSSLTSPLIR